MHIMPLCHHNPKGLWLFSSHKSCQVAPFRSHKHTILWISHKKVFYVSYIIGSSASLQACLHSVSCRRWNGVCLSVCLSVCLYLRALVGYQFNGGEGPCAPWRHIVYWYLIRCYESLKHNAECWSIFMDLLWDTILILLGLYMARMNEWQSLGFIGRLNEKS